MNAEIAKLFESDPEVVEAIEAFEATNAIYTESMRAMGQMSTSSLHVGNTTEVVLSVRESFSTNHSPSE